MSRLIATLMIVTLLIGHGMSYAAAICHHQNAQEHALALVSVDGAVAAQAIGEETVAAAAEGVTKGASFRTSTAAWAADMLPLPTLPVPVRIVEQVRTPIADADVPPGRSVSPLLEPPAA